MNRLSGAKVDFPLERISEHGRWRLKSQVQQQWFRLESLLVKAYEVLLSSRPEFGHPVGIKPYRLPSCWGYLRTHETEKHARIRIWNSRNAFTPLMALVMYAICVCEGRNSIPLEDRTNITWIKMLVESGFCPEWVNDLANSHFFSMRVLRVGLYIDFATFSYPHLLRLYIEFGIPVWIRVDVKSIPNLPAFMRPGEQQQQQLSATTQRVAVSLNVPSTRQLNGESIHQFISRQIQRNRRRQASETPDERSKRLDRERSATSFHTPSRSGPAVFQWLENNGSLERTYVPRIEVEAVWESYSDTQKW